MLPSGSTLSSCSSLFGQNYQVLPIHFWDDKKMFRFKDYGQALYNIFEIYELQEIAKYESIELAVTVDGADLTKYLSHVTAGIKIVSKNGKFDKSHTHCFPFMTILCRDSKVSYEQYIDSFFEWFNTVAGGQNGVNGWKPLLISSCQDMSSHWKTLRKGNGSRNNSTYFCHCCAKENLYIALPNNSPCVN